MKRMIMAALLLAFTPSWGSSSERLTPLPSGTLLFLQNGSKIVEGYTRSGVSHVAIVMQEEGKLWVYEATPAKVRRMALADYCTEVSKLNLRRQKKMRVWSYPPMRRFPQQAVTSMKSYLDEQLGRRYSVKGIVRGKKGDGVHCSQLAAQTLQRSGKLDFDGCHLITPGDLRNHIGSYFPVHKEIALPVVADNRKWCERSWDRFKGYCAWCGWSCRETFSWLY